MTRKEKLQTIKDILDGNRKLLAGITLLVYHIDGVYSLEDGTPILDYAAFKQEHKNDVVLLIQDWFSPVNN